MSNGVSSRQFFETSLAISLTALAVKLVVTSVNPISAVAFLALNFLPGMVERFMPSTVRIYIMNHPALCLFCSTIVSFFAVQKFLDPSFVLMSALKTIAVQLGSEGLVGTMSYSIFPVPAQGDRSLPQEIEHDINESLPVDEEMRDEEHLDSAEPASLWPAVAVAAGKSYETEKPKGAE